MPSYSRVLLSGSTNGKPIKLAATATPGTAVHTAAAGTAAFDEVYLWVTNTHTVAVNLTIEWGGTTDPDHLVCKNLVIGPNSPPIPVVTGLTVNNAVAIKAFASVANKLLITGYVNRIA